MKTPKDLTEKTWDSDRAISCIRAAYWASCVHVLHKKRHLSIYYKGCNKRRFLNAIRPLIDIWSQWIKQDAARVTKLMVDFCEHKLDTFGFELCSDEYGISASENRPYEHIQIDLLVRSERQVER